MDWQSTKEISSLQKKTVVLSAYLLSGEGQFLVLVLPRRFLGGSVFVVENITDVMSCMYVFMYFWWLRNRERLSLSWRVRNLLLIAAH
jgi:hypothetical protein